MSKQHQNIMSEKGGGKEESSYAINLVFPFLTPSSLVCHATRYYYCLVFPFQPLFLFLFFGRKLFLFLSARRKVAKNATSKNRKQQQVMLVPYFFNIETFSNKIWTRILNIEMARRPYQKLITKCSTY